MALSTRNEIRAQIIEEREYFESDSDRAISELADSLTPIYNSDVITEWSDLPMSESDAWQEYGIDENASIIDRMKFDLWLYYDQAVREIYEEERENWHTCDPLAPNLYHSSPINGAIRCHDCDLVIIAECACEANDHTHETN